MVKFFSCNFEGVQGEATSMQRHRRTCGLNEVRDTVLDGEIGSTGLNQSRKLRKKSKVRVRGVLLDGGRVR